MLQTAWVALGSSWVTQSKALTCRNQGASLNKVSSESRGGSYSMDYRTIKQGDRLYIFTYILYLYIYLP